MPTLGWTDYDGKDEEFHATRLTPAIRPFIGPHRHEYAELVFVEQGWCIHRVNNRGHLMNRGALMLVRPKVDIHSFHEHSDNVSVFRISIKQESLDYICNRYFVDKEDLWGHENHTPHVYTLNDTQCLWMTKTFRTLTAEVKSRLHIERFLMNLIDELLHTDYISAITFPDDNWVVEAYEWLRNPLNFNLGLKRLGNHVCKTPEHIARVMKKKFGKTPVELLNEARLIYACEQLAFTNKDIIDIAYECGFSGISHLYRLFSKHTGRAPLAYRKEKQRE